MCHAVFATPTTNFELKLSQKLIVVVAKRGIVEKFRACSKDVLSPKLGNYVFPFSPLNSPPSTPPVNTMDHNQIKSVHHLLYDNVC